MGYADELAKMTKTKQQIKAEEQALEAKCRDAWYKVLSEQVEEKALSILSDCSEAAKKGERSYICINPSPYFPAYSFPTDFDAPEEIGALAKKYYHDNHHYCYKEFKTALVARLEEEGLKVKLENNTLLNLINELSPDGLVRIKLRW